MEDRLAYRLLNISLKSTKMPKAIRAPNVARRATASHMRVNSAYSTGVPFRPS